MAKVFSSPTLFEILMLVVIFIQAFYEHANGKLNLVTITAGKFSVLSAATVAPAYAVAIEDMSKRYPDIFANHTVVPINVALKVNPGTPEGDWLVVEELVKEYGAGVLRSNDPTVILNSISARIFSTVGDFAREDNLVTLSCGPSEPNPARYPTNIIFYPGSAFDFGAGVIATMDALHWRSVAVIWDLCSALINSARVEGLLRGLLPLLERRSMDIDALVIKMDSTLEVLPKAYYSALWRAGNHSRIIVCGILNRELLELMAAASDIGFISGNNYVFIHVYGLEVPGEQPPGWKEMGGIDLKVREAFERLLIVRSQPLNWTQAEPLTERIVQRINTMFGIPYDAENKLNEFAIGCYESVELLSDVLNRSGLDGHSIDPGVFMQQLKGQTFQLTLRNVSFGPGTTRPPTIVLQKFNSLMATFQIIAKLNPSSRAWSTGDSIQGELWNGVVPPDRPLCGIHGERCQAQTSTAITIGIVVAVIATGTGFAALYWYHQRYLRVGGNVWWCLESALTYHRVTL
ncbi:hypothetical protein BV898_09768 [Hypsibius exemplaris]|uniref:Receptor ligand binding region domain-containing protein n=1 Tax=Hypsibius exemplaris TaxID=2072580 RepID=A0A1W0WLY3_HYPEX|nr:hypothetical protein BV898_09768 [Hypsibius exemplaris]